MATILTILLACIALLHHEAHAIIAPNTSLATVPTAYFGGNYARRGDANIAMVLMALFLF